MILYVSKRFETNMCARVHLSILKELYGEDQVFIIDLRLGNEIRKDRYIAYGKYKKKADRIIRIAQGNTMYISNSIIKEIIKIIQRDNIELVFLEDSFFGNLTRKIKKKLPAVKVISFYHDIGADLFVQWSRQKKGCINKIECIWSIKQEKVNQKFADYNIVLNQREAALYEKFYAKKPDYIVPISSYIPDNTSLPDEKPYCKPKTLLFVGSTYYPNIVGIRWFYKNVLPYLSNDIIINIVGRGLELLREEFVDKRVNVIGTVDDLTWYYRNADIFIAPIFDGGGMKTKSVEAISFAKCFVGTAESLMGFWEKMDGGVKNSIVFKCNTADEWVAVLNNLVESEIYKFNQKLYDIYIENFSYDATKKEFAKILGMKGH